MKQIQIYLKYELYMSSVYVNGVNIRFIICGMLLCQEKKSITFKMNITQISSTDRKIGNPLSPLEVALKFCLGSISAALLCLVCVPPWGGEWAPFPNSGW